MPPTPSSKMPLIIGVLSVAAALLGVATAYLGYQTATITKEKEQAQQSAAVSGSDVTTLRAENSQLKTHNQQLQDQINTLQTGGSSSSTVDTPGPGPAAGTIRHKGPLVLIYGPEADLDAPASDTKWSNTSQGGDLVLGRNGSLIITGGVQRSDPSTTAQDYNSCSRNPRLKSGIGIDRGDVRVGSWFCVKTTEHRYAALEITRIVPPAGQDATDSEVDFNVTMYDPPNGT